MKKQLVVISTFIVVVLCGVLAITQSSCSKQKDPCASVTCQNKGTCADGTCTCPTGYSGANCETPYASKYYGSYVGFDLGSPPVVDTFVISADTGAYGLTILRKVHPLTFKAVVHNDTLTIPSQLIPVGSFNETVSGSGIFSTTVLSATVTESLQGATNITTFTGSKQ